MNNKGTSLAIAVLLLWLAGVAFYVTFTLGKQLNRRITTDPEKQQVGPGLVFSALSQNIQQEAQLKGK